METKFSTAKIKLEARVGMNIFDCIYEGCLLALQERVIVEVKHNDKLTEIDPQKILNAAFNYEFATRK